MDIMCVGGSITGMLCKLAFVNEHCTSDSDVMLEGNVESNVISFWNPNCWSLISSKQ